MKKPDLMGYAETQMAFGPRTPGSAAHAEFVDWAVDTLEKSGWEVSAEPAQYKGKEVINILAEHPGKAPESKWLLLGAHYDCRLNADKDLIAGNRLKPVPGANDGASGVAVLMGLAETLRDSEKRITLAFFDAEDQGELPGWGTFCYGAEVLADQYAAADEKPDEVIILDMIGDADLQIYREGNSDPELTDRLWQIAAEKGFSDRFINERKYTMIDDHVPFRRIGIPSVDLIDFDYPYWHTVGDTIDKLSEKSLNAVYQVVYEYAKQ